MDARGRVEWTVELGRGEVLTLPPGLVVRCRAGSLWLTEYHPGRDVLLRSGDVHTAGGRGPVLVSGRCGAVLAVGLADGSDPAAMPGVLRSACIRLGSRLCEGGERFGAGLHGGAGLPAR